MRRLVLLVLVAIPLSMSGASARGDLITFNSRAAFDAATASRTVIDFSGLAPDGGFSYFGSPGSLTVDGVNFQSSGPLFVQNDGIASRLTFQQDVPTNSLDVTLPMGSTAVGFEYEAGTVLTLTLDSGESVDLPIVDFPDFEFFGFTIDHPIASFHLESIGGGDLMNFTFGQAVPEPSSVALLGTTALGLVGWSRRRRDTAR